MDQPVIGTPTENMEGIELTFVEGTPSPCGNVFRGQTVPTSPLEKESQRNNDNDQEELRRMEASILKEDAENQAYCATKVVVETVVEPPTPSIRRMASQDALYYESLSEELAEAKVKLQHTSSKLYLLTLENASYKEMVVRLERHADELQNDLDGKTSSETEMAATIKQLETGLLDTKRRHSVDMRNLMKNVRTEIETLKRAKDETAAENKFLNTRILKLSNAEDDKSQLIRSLTAKAQALESKVRVLEEKITSDSKGQNSQMTGQRGQHATKPTLNVDGASGVCQIV